MRPNEKAQFYIKNKWNLKTSKTSTVRRISPKTTQKMLIIGILTKRVILCSVAVTVSVESLSWADKKALWAGTWAALTQAIKQNLHD